MVQRTFDGRILVIVDANILINLLKIGRFSLLRSLTGYAFRIPQEVLQEIRHPDQQAELLHALQEGWIEEIRIDDMEELRLYAHYIRQMGDGEAACLAVAVKRKWVVACDEGRKQPFHREICRRLGAPYLFNTPGILLQAIKTGVITVEEADHLKGQLAQHRFLMNFQSFREYLDSS